MKEKHGLEILLQEAWERYHLPMAVTEVHIGCSREEQMRWLKHVWDTCCGLRRRGVDIRAVTPWSLLGAFDWNSLLTRQKMHYEPGVFDISSGELRPTAMAEMIRSLALYNRYDHPLLDLDGWWKRDLRYISGKVSRSPVLTTADPHRPLLVIGKHGSLASAFARICEIRGIPAMFMSRNDMDILDRSTVEQRVEELKPWAMVNCAGFVDVDRAEGERSACMRINADAPELLAEVCHGKGIPFLTFSSDLVFNGEKKNPYTETDHVQPLSIYGESKAVAEEKVLKAYPGALVIRSSAFFGPWDKYNFVYSVLRSIRKNTVLELPGDVVVSPTYLPDMVHASLDLLIDGAKGIWHLANDGYVSWADFAQEVAKQADKGNFQLIRKRMEEMSWIAARPLYSVLETEKGPRLPTLDNALERYFRESVAV
jgi:dTDP-4-dehydrorhamnose reductase